SLMNRADIPAALAALDRTIAIPALPDATRRQLEGSRAFLLAQAGRAPDAAEQDAMMARFAAADDQDAQAKRWISCGLGTSSSPSRTACGPAPPCCPCPPSSSWPGPGRPPRGPPWTWRGG